MSDCKAEVSWNQRSEEDSTSAKRQQCHWRGPEIGKKLKL